MKQIIPYFIHDKLEKGITSGHFKAHTMFVDLSGFTPLTDRLMQEGSEGAEKLSVILNDIFDPMVQRVYAKQGFIPHFAGDAFTAVFEHINADSLLETAKSILGLFDQEIGNNFLFDIDIGVKIGLSSGDVEWGILGEDYKTYYFKGEAIQQSVECMLLASRGQIIFDDLFKKQIRQPVRHKYEGNQSGHYRLIDAATYDDFSWARSYPPLKRHLVSRFLPEAIMNYQGRGEFRNVISIFISFEGLEELEELNAFVNIVLKNIHSYTGYFKEIDFGDKGGLIVAFFGAPITFENVQDRALQFILSLQKSLASMVNDTPLRYRVGITYGLAFAGWIGGKERCQYALASSRVNLAARLAIHSNWGKVLVDEEMHKNRQFLFSYEGDIHYKGIRSKIPTYRLIGKNTVLEPMFEGKMVGRQTEIESLLRHIIPCINGQSGGILYIHGEAGIGKSRLAYELQQSLKSQQPQHWINCPCDQILRKPFNPFIHFFRSYFNLSPENSEEENLGLFEQKFQDLLALQGNTHRERIPQLKEELMRTKSVIAARLGIQYPDSLWDELDYKGKLENTYEAIETLIALLATEKPVVVKVEDGHWIDEISIEMVNNLVKKITRFPITLLFTSRFKDDGTPHQFIRDDVLVENGIEPFSIELHYLNLASLKLYAEQTLGGKISTNLLNLLMQTTNANPFYVEQLLEYFQESELLTFTGGEWTIKDQKISLSTSIKAILMARIDRLSSLVKETVKTAAVIGREFEIPILSDVLRTQEGFGFHPENEVIEQIKVAESEQIWRAVNELRYMFRHSLLREAVYDMQLRTRLRELHQLIGDAIERRFKDNVENRYDELAFHYKNAQNREKSIEYLKKAGDYARVNFQNLQALKYYNDVLDLLKRKSERSRRIKVLLRKANILELIGEWELCTSVYDEILALADKENDDQLRARAYNGLGNLLTLQGQYEKAKDVLVKSVEIFERIEDTMGQSVSYGTLGNIHFRTGQYEQAKEYFTSSIKLSQYHNYISYNADIFATLGLTYMNLGDYSQGIKCILSQLLLSNQLIDKRGMATLYTNVGIIHFERGDYDNALTNYTKGLELSRALGNKLLTSIAIGCIGNVYEKKGDYKAAEQLYEEDLVLCEEMGDKQGIAIACGLIGGLECARGNWDKAEDFSQRSFVICQALGYKKGIAKARHTLGRVAMYRGFPEDAERHFIESASLAFEIHNKAILAAALIGKLQLQVNAGINNLDQNELRELTELAETLKNKEILFQTNLLKVHSLIGSKELDRANSLLKELLVQYPNEEQQAIIYFYLYNYNQENVEYKQVAADLMESLVKKEPKYSLIEKLELLIQS